MAEHKRPEETKEKKVKEETEDVTVEDTKEIDPKAKRELERPSENDIKQMKRGELNELAAGYGLDPDEYKRADDLRSAIFDYLKSENEKAGNKETATETASADADEEEAEVKKGPKPNPTRPRIERQGKRYRAAAEQVEKGKTYELGEAVDLVVKTSKVKFDAAVELHINLGVDPKQADQLIRGTILLPHGSGKSQRVAALVPDDGVDKAKKAGADLAGNKSILDDIGNNKIEFDILVAHPDLMKDLSKHAKVLGPQGLMPSPKAGTVTPTPETTIKELKAGRIEYRVDRYGLIHQIIGRVSFKPEQLRENAETLLQAVKAARPSSTKGVYFQKATLNAAMGPGIKLDLGSIG